MVLNSSKLMVKSCWLSLHTSTLLPIRAAALAYHQNVGATSRICLFGCIRVGKTNIPSSEPQQIVIFSGGTQINSANFPLHTVFLKSGYFCICVKKSLFRIEWMLLGGHNGLIF